MGSSKTEEEQNSATTNYPDLRGKESGVAGDEAGGDTLWGLGRVRGVFGEDRLCGGGAAASAIPLDLAQRDGSVADVHAVFAVGVGGGSTFCAHGTAARRSGLAAGVGDSTVPFRRYHPQLVQAFWAGTKLPILLGAVGVADGATARAGRGLQPGLGFHRV